MKIEPSTHKGFDIHLKNIKKSLDNVNLEIDKLENFYGKYFDESSTQRYRDKMKQIIKYDDFLVRIKNEIEKF